MPQPPRPPKKRLFQNFSEFRGIDLRSSDLSRPNTAAKEASNFEIEKDFTLGGAKGFKTNCGNVSDPAIVATHNYIYKDPDTGEEKEEFIGIGDVLYRQKEGSLTVTYAGSEATWGWAVYLASTNNFVFTLSSDGGSNFAELDLSTGLEDDTTGVVTLDALRDWINTTPGGGSVVDDFSATMSPDTATTQAQAATILPVFEELSYVKASQPSFAITFKYWEAVPDFARNGSANTCPVFRHYTESYQDPKVPLPTFLNKDNVCYIATGGALPLLKYDGQNLVGAGMLEVTDDDVEIGSTGSGGNTGTFRYYIRAVRRDNRGNFIYGRGGKTDQVTIGGSASPQIKLFDRAANSRGLTADVSFAVDYMGGVLLGQDSTTAGTSATLTFDAAIDETGLPYYGFEELRVGDLLYVSYGYAGDYVRITAIDRAAKTITMNQSINIGNPTLVYRSYMEFRPKLGVLSTAPSSSSTFSVTNKLLDEGDWLYFKNPGDWFKVTDITGFAITIDGLVTGSIGDYVTDVVIEIYRTEDGGTEKFYHVETVPINEFIGADYEDTVTDANLGAELILPTNELDPLKEKPTFIANHQGVIIAGGGRSRPSRLYYEDFQYNEAFPLATNFYDVPSQDAGTLTAAWSDSFDQLAVFKESAYYSVVGDFTEDVPILITTPNTENDVGISSQNSLLKVRGMNVGVGKLGIFIFKNGQVDYEISKQIDPIFLIDTIGEDIAGAAQLRFNRAIGVNDKFKQQAMFFIPAFNLDSSGNFLSANDNSKIIVFDYSEMAWLTREFPSDLSAGSSGLLDFPFLPTAGMLVFEDRLHFSGCVYDSTIASGDDWSDFTTVFFRRKEKTVPDASTTDYRYDYADQHVAITYDYKSQWQFGMTPIVNHLFQYLKIYFLNTTDFVPFTLQVRTYLNWDDTTAIDDISISVTTSTPFAILKLQATRGQCLMIRFTTSALHTKPSITGYELIPADADPDMEGVA